MKKKQTKETLLFYSVCTVCLAQLIFSTATFGQQELLVHSLTELHRAVQELRTGTKIVLADGTYRGETLLESAAGTEKAPIVIRAENQGKALIESPITLRGNHIVLIGCRFQEQGKVTIEGKNCRLSRCTFSDSKATKWVRVLPGSSQIEIDYNLFENKTINLTERSCQLMQIMVLNQNERHHIHHNLFRNIPPGKGNGYETLQLITRGNPFDPPPGHCQTVIEHNLFLRCNGEAEVISVKSNGNLIRGNTFRACRGSLVFRHGDENVATQNWFFGDGEPGSGGIRLQGTDQVVANNHFHGLSQFGIGMMDGTPDDLYIRVERAKILFNTFVDCNPALVVGINHSRHPNGTTPKDCQMAGNIFYTGMQHPVFEFIQNDPPENWVWVDNIVFGETTQRKKDGIREVDPFLEIRGNGMAFPTEGTPASNSRMHQHALLDADLLGQARRDNKTLGAIQYPVKDIKMGFLTEEMVGPNAEKPVLHKRIPIPVSLRTQSHGLEYGGDIRIGDLQNNRQAAFIVYRSALYHEGGATQPCFLGAFTQCGDVLWTKGEGGFQPNRPGPVAVHDIDADGKTEVITLFTETPEQADPHSMQHVSLQILNGETGETERRASPAELTSAAGEGLNWVHQRILIANLRGKKTPQDFIIKLGTRVLAFDHELNLLWTYENPWSEYQHCPAYIPSVGDMDDDGRDEINGGYYVLDSSGKPVWEKKLGKNMDSVTINFWDHGKKKRAFASGYGQVLDREGNIILKLGMEAVPHGQELRVADFEGHLPGHEMIIRYNGHNEQVILVGNRGKIIRRFDLNPSPNNTGMEVVYWFGRDKPAVLYNGGMLWSGDGSRSFDLPALPPEQGAARQGWFHCIPADVSNDTGEEVIVYNPWSCEVFIYTRTQPDSFPYQGYQATARQYNVRLMD